MTLTQPYYIGLMSGTSLDGIDAVLTTLNADKIDIVRHASIPYPSALQQEFMALFTPDNNELQRCQQAAHQRTNFAIEVVKTICKNFRREEIIAIADHGQTIRHYPNAHPPYTLQVHQGARLAANTGITTIVDFRSKDIADGGQGAPLVPAFHQAMFADQRQHRVIVNIGGIANISLLPPTGAQASLGFDTGPGNTLLDGWCQQHTHQNYDDEGRWGSSGVTNQELLAILLQDDYFTLAPPKSTGREQFNMRWLNQKLQQRDFSACAANDIQATLAAFTARTIHLGIQTACAQSNISQQKDIEAIYVCGGGAYNSHLMQCLQAETNVPVKTTEAIGVPPKLVEAAAFAWLGKMAIERRPVDLRRTTGATRSNVLGAIYPA